MTGQQQLVKLRFPLEVTHASLDTKLRSSGLFLSSGWATQDPKITFLVDLSAVEYVDFSTAARLITVLEGAALRGHQLRIIAPRMSRWPSESQFLQTVRAERPADYFHHDKQIAKQVRRRQGAYHFLRHVGFFRALTMPHLPHLACRPRLDLSGDSTTSLPPLGQLPQDDAGPGVPDLPVARQYPGILPFRWITEDILKEGSWEEETIEFLYDEGLVMTRTDSVALVNKVLHELVENVIEHAPVGHDGQEIKPGALVGAITLNRAGRRYTPRPETFYESNTSFVEWLSLQNSPIVRVSVADAGVGLCKTIADEFGRRALETPQRRPSPSELNRDQVFFAFEPTSSRHVGRQPRGVGLAAVRRFVRSYQGMVNVRTSNVCVGFSYQGLSKEQLNALNLSYSPGTALDVTLGLTLQGRDRTGRDARVARSETQLLPVELQHTDSEFLMKTAFEALSHSSADRAAVLVLVNGWFRKAGREALAFAIACSRVADRLRGHAGLVVLLTDASEHDVATSFKSVDDLRKRTTEAVQRGWPLKSWSTPFLVMAADGSVHWAASSTTLRGLLYRLYETGSLKLDDIEGASNLSQKDLDYLQTERDWLRVDNSGDLHFCLRTEEVDGQVADVVRSALSSRVGAPRFD